MATREGIYVGGHEIVERYVGSKLVWQKWRFLKRFSNFSYAMIDRYASDRVVVSGGLVVLENGFDTGTRKLKIINYSNYGTEVFYAKRAYVYGRNTGENNYIESKVLYIQFNSNIEASNFMERHHAGTIDIYV